MTRKDHNLIFEKRYDVLDGSEVAKRISDIFEKQCPLSDYQKDWLRRSLGDSGMCGNLDMPFQAYEWERNIRKKTDLQRISTPFVVLMNILMLLVVCPMHFLFTGKFFIDCNNKWFEPLYKCNKWALGE